MLGNNTRVVKQIKDIGTAQVISTIQRGGNRLRPGCQRGKPVEPHQTNALDREQEPGKRTGHRSTRHAAGKTDGHGSNNEWNDEQRVTDGRVCIRNDKKKSVKKEFPIITNGAR